MDLRGALSQNRNHCPSLLVFSSIVEFSEFIKEILLYLFGIHLPVFL